MKHNWVEVDARNKVSLHLSGDAAADKLLSEDPFALLIGMVLDQQIPLERAFYAPKALEERLGVPLDPSGISLLEPSELAAIFSAKPALHRFPFAMADRVAKLARVITETYGGDAASIWKSAPDAKELLRRIESLPGFGKQKAKIFVALLGKQLRVTPPGWEKASHPFSAPGSTLSIADIVGPESLAKVRQYKASLKAAAKASAPAPLGGSPRLATH